MYTAPNWFTDMLNPGEEVLSSLGAAGQEDKSWYQVALTQDRLLVVCLRENSGSYMPTRRYSCSRNSVRMHRYPSTPRSQARLEIKSAGTPVVLTDIDSPAVFPHLEKFLAAWGGVVEGAGAFVQRPDIPTDLDTPGPQMRPLMLLLLAMVLVGLSGIGCTVLAVLMRAII